MSQNISIALKGLKSEYLGMKVYECNSIYEIIRVAR